MKNIILIVGPSGSGKTAIAQELCKKYGWKEIQSYTERPRRYPDESGHIFITPAEFDAIPTEEYVAYTEYNSYRYCATQQQVEECDVYVVDSAGVEYFWQNYKGSKVPLVLHPFVTPQTARERMLAQGRSPESVEERIRYDAKAFADKSFLKHYNWVSINNGGDIEKTIEGIDGALRMLGVVS